MPGCHCRWCGLAWLYMADDGVSRELVAATLQQDENAARELVRSLYPLVAKLVRAHRPVRSAEEDLCQMIFIKVMQKLSQFSGKVPLEHWVSRIAINTCINQIQAEKARPELREADLSEEQAAVIRNLAATTGELTPDQSFASRELVEHLMKALKPAERLVIDLLYLQQRSVAEIQRLTGWSGALVKVRAFRARQKMKQRMSKIAAREKT
jgi:RNA polymerase sigma-70 factor (ECF subfamily)